MKNITKRFAELQKLHERAFIPFLVIGDPNPEIFMEIVKSIEPYSDIIELGIPFSDPMADGPVIQSADMRALGAGVNLDNCFEYIQKIRQFTQKPIVVLTYANILGIEPQRLETLTKLANVGVNGVIAADIPIEEAKSLSEDAKKAGIDLIFLATPTTSTERLEKILTHVGGFLYLVSVKGVTGARSQIMEETAQTITRITGHIQKLAKNQNTHIPVCVGFGISTPEHVKEVIRLGADGAIVGSAIIQRIEQNLTNTSKLIQELTSFVKNMKEATKTNSIKEK